MSLRMVRALGLAAFFFLIALPLAAAQDAGKISGLVVDAGGTPQMGATVFVSAEQLLSSAPIEVLTNDRGRFSTATLAPGMYSVKVTLAGFLPAVDQHILVTDQRGTLLEIVLGSMFSSLDKMRHDPNQPVPADEWSWVLRASAATRPVLRWNNDDLEFGGDPLALDASGQPILHGRLDLTDGSDHPGSISNLADSPATAFAYAWTLGGHAKVLMAGQFSYDGATPAGGISTEWLPSGEVGVGPSTSVLIRESRVGPDGPVFRAFRIAHDDQFSIGDRVTVRYGADYLMAGLDGTTQALRPRAEVAIVMAPGWLASITVAEHPWQGSSASTSDLQDAMNTLDALPTLLLRNGRPILADGLHEELAVERILDKNDSLTAAVFHDRSNQTAVFGRGAVSGGDYLPDVYSDVFAYDAGASSSTGVRLAYRRKVSDTTDATFVYSYAGALAPADELASAALRDQLSTQYRSSAAARISTQIPRLHTRLSTGYKWLSGSAVSPQDAWGEAIYHVDPYLSIQLRQPLPSFIPGHVEALVDVGNLLKQGYVPIATADGNVILVPSYRYLRGGLSFQF
ncbi:MAG: carboxypeptidase-like regulatory domain-containing protein [Candidatus Acidiferrales bacterium]